MKTSLPPDALDRVFREGRTYHTWLPGPVEPKLLQDLYDLVKLGPTSANCSPARLVFLTTPAAKERLIPALSPNNVPQVRQAPVTAIVAWDNDFYEHLPRLFPFADARSWFAGNPKIIQETAFRNSSLQGAYLILAARSLGLDAGPMSGFDQAKANAEFFPDGKWSSNFLCNLGYGDPSSLHPRAPRLEFNEACLVL
jgi:3-hydroxypropanoate dehydrogenase